MTIGGTGATTAIIGGNGVRAFRQNVSNANFFNTIVGPRVMRFGVRVNF